MPQTSPLRDSVCSVCEKSCDVGPILTCFRGCCSRIHLACVPMVTSDARESKDLGENFLCSNCVLIKNSGKFDYVKSLMRYSSWNNYCFRFSPIYSYTDGRTHAHMNARTHGRNHVF